MAFRFLGETEAHIEKLENGFVFEGKYYKTIDDMKDDLINSIKTYFLQ